MQVKHAIIFSMLLSMIFLPLKTNAYEDDAAYNLERSRDQLLDRRDRLRDSEARINQQMTRLQQQLSAIDADLRDTESRLRDVDSALSNHR